MSETEDLEFVLDVLEGGWGDDCPSHNLDDYFRARNILRERLNMAPVEIEQPSTRVSLAGLTKTLLPHYGGGV